MMYNQDNHIRIYNKDCRGMSELPDESVDLITTDPPYGISFMGKDWDRALPDKRIWKECLRVLKPGAFAFVMSIPRADCLSRMVIALEDAGFWVDFTPIFWTYASGFPKAQNIGKKIEGLKGAYAGFQPKPAVEIILVAMKPLLEKTYVDQALKNGKGITWLDDGRIPYESEEDKSEAKPQGRPTSKIGALAGGMQNERERNEFVFRQSGRFPANLLVSDDVLNDGQKHSSGKLTKEYLSRISNFVYGHWNHRSGRTIGDSGSFSRYFDLDKWWEERIKQLPESVQRTFPFAVVSKASKSEKGKDNRHPTVKPVKLMSYLIILGSREGDTVVDPFIGTGSTAIACQILGRGCTGYEINPDYCEIAKGRLSWCWQKVLL